MSIPDHRNDPAELDARDRNATSSTGLGGQLECFLRNAPEVMLAVDGSGTIVFVNSGVTSLFGYLEQELLGRRIDVIVPESFGDEGSRRLSALLQASDPDAKRTGMEVEGKHKDGSPLELEVGLTLLGPRHRDLAIWTIRDVTERKCEARRMERSESRLNEAQRIAKIGNWEWDVAADSHWWSDELYRIFGLEPGEFAASFEAFLESLHLKSQAGSLIVMDEIGKMECFSAAFVSLVRELLDGAGVVVATVALKGPEFISEVKRRGDVVIYEVTERNRDSLAERLAQDIQAALRSFE